MVEKILLLSISISIILLYIYDTDTIWFYFKKIASIIKNKNIDYFFNGKLLVSAYENNLNNEGNYLLYLNRSYNTFFTNLISCPICSGFWISLFFSLIFLNIYMALIVSYTSLVLYCFLKMLINLSNKI